MKGIKSILLSQSILLSILAIMMIWNEASLSCSHVTAKTIETLFIIFAVLQAREAYKIKS